MSPLDVRVAKLVDEISRDWAAVEAHLQRAQSVDPKAGDPEAALVALSLDHAYQGFETLMVRIERVLGLPERTGADAVTADWEELLRFRHFLRHAYTVGLDAERLQRNRARLTAAVSATAPSIRALIDALQA
jgi:hypothetical protein